MERYAIMHAVQLLSWNAGAQIAFASFLGWAMLVPHQPWGRRWKRLHSRDVTAAHLDWMMLAFMQFGASYALANRPLAHGEWIAGALIAGGWLNPVPYALRAFGINAFAFAGDWKQRTSAAISGISSLLITGAWVAFVVEAWP
jgi:hypothetical protein